MINRKGYKISETYEKQFPCNCPVMEYSADGDYVGICCFYLEDENNTTCPRHGVVKDNVPNGVRQ